MVVLGIPYAKPPNRFQHSELIGNFDQEIDGENHTPTCYQAGYPASPMMSEDCLTLDVYRPANLGQRKPGMLIWLHGGGLNL